MTTGVTDWIGNGLGAAARVMLGERAAAGAIEDDPASLRSSLLGVAMGLVIGAGVLATGASGDLSASATFFRSLALGTASYAAAVAAILALTREASQRARLPAWFAARNWAEAVLASVLLVPTWLLVSSPAWRVEGAEVSGSPALASALVLGIVAIDFLGHWRLLVHVLGVSGLRAFWMVVAANISATLASIVLG